MSKPTSSNAVMTPSRELLRAATFLERTVTRFLGARKTAGPMGRYEHHDASHSLLVLIARHVEAIVELARRDVVFLPAAMTLARAAFETSVRALWMLDPDDPLERDARYLALLREEEDFLTHISDDEVSINHVRQVREFIEGVSALLPHDVAVPAGRQRLLQMLRDIEAEDLYLHYRHLSQYAHGTFFAIRHYQRHLGTLKEFGEWIEEPMWSLPLSVGFLAIGKTGSLWLHHLGGSQFTFVSASWKKAVEDAIDAVAQGSGATP